MRLRENSSDLWKIFSTGKKFPAIFVENIFHRFLASRLFICSLEVSFPESTKSSAKSIQLFCLSTTAALPALVTSWPHQDGLVQHWQPCSHILDGLLCKITSYIQRSQRHPFLLAMFAAIFQELLELCSVRITTSMGNPEPVTIGPKDITLKVKYEGCIFGLCYLQMRKIQF